MGPGRALRGRRAKEQDPASHFHLKRSCCWRSVGGQNTEGGQGGDQSCHGISATVRSHRGQGGATLYFYTRAHIYLLHVRFFL